MYRISGIASEGIQEYIRKTSSIYFIEILRGEAEGIIWADHGKSPRMLMIWSEYQKGFQLMGKALEQKVWKKFYSWFEDVIIPFLKSKQMDVFECGVDSKELAQMLEGIFARQDIKCEKQKILMYDGRLPLIEEPSEYVYKKVDKEFLHTDYANKSYIIDEIELAYGSCEHYLEKGYGYAALKDNEIVARAIMTFSFEGQDNISVDTLEKHRRKGLSAYLVSKVVEECVKRKHIPIWDCSEYNTASQNTAKKCGFKVVREDDIYWFKEAIC